jgi:hypothetical protein
MASRERTMCTRVAIAATLMIGLPSLSSAQDEPGSEFGVQITTARPTGEQGRRAGEREGEYTPAPGARDLKSVLFNWAWHMGMLRSTEEYDLIMSLVYEGTGTVQTDGQPCNVTKYRSDISYQTSGERIRITGTRPNGQSCSTIEVLSGAYTWNEDVQGAELIPGQGKATPMPAAVEERMIRLWANPQGAWKSAMAGTQDTDAPQMAARPQRVPADVMKVNKTSVEWVDGKPVLTFPIPGVPTATATATLDARFMAERVVVKNGRDTYEFTYGNYKDWNNPLHPAEAFYTGKITEKKNGAVVLDITTTVTETGQMYVVMPVPPSVKAAIRPTHRPPNWTLDKAPPSQAAAAPTPRRADGKPDLTGTWSRPFNPITGNGARRCGPTQVKGGGINPEFGCTGGQDNFWVEYAWISPSRFGVLGRPIYKPELWDQIQELDMWTNKYDPVMTCKPLGLPRHGTPTRIVQSDIDVIFFYPINADYGGGNNEYRNIPTDGRERSALALDLATFYGQSIGRWEGDTLVIESINFDDSTWLGRGGLIHSGSMRIVERLARVGNEIRYDMTIEDPEMFIEPWVMPTRILTLNPRPDGGIMAERAACEVYEEDNVTSQVRH